MQIITTTLCIFLANAGKNLVQDLKYGIFERKKQSEVKKGNINLKKKCP